MIVGASPRPAHEDDSRLPYVVSRAEKAIHKTALGAEKTVAWRYAETLLQATHMLADEAFTFVALEQTASSEPLEALKISANTALVVGREVEGLTPVEVRLCTGGAYEIPMLGDKESLNVSVASGIALYHAIMSHKE